MLKLGNLYKDTTWKHKLEAWPLSFQEHVQLSNDEVAEQNSQLNSKNISTAVIQDGVTFLKKEVKHVPLQDKQ